MTVEAAGASLHRMVHELDPPPSALATTARALPAPPRILQLEVGLLQNFCALLSCPRTGEAAVVDPAWEVDRLLDVAKKMNLRIAKILVTHGHNDHVEGVAEVVRLTDASVVLDERELERVRTTTGMTSARWEVVADSEDVAIGDCGVRALASPGHTEGGLCFLADGYVVTGDVLFVGGCGRTDFPGGDAAKLWSTLQRLAQLPEETRVYPGHDYGSTATSTIGRELLENPYFRCQNFDEFQRLRSGGRSPGRAK